MKRNQTPSVALVLGALFVLFTVFTVSAAQSAVEGPLLGPWTDVQQPIPTPRKSVACCVAGLRLWVIGGVDSTGAVKSTVEAYDPFSNVWESDTTSGGPHSPLPVARADACAAAVGTTIYVFGGRRADGTLMADVDVYDTSSHTWTSRSPMPAAVQGASAAVYAGKIHVLGGFTSSGTPFYSVYDPSTDKWSAGPYALPSAVGSGAAAVALDRSTSPVEDYLYYSGGAASDGSAVTSFWRRGLKSGTGWNSPAPLNYGRSGHASCCVTGVNVAGGSLDYPVIFGGSTVETGYTNSVQVFVPEPYNGWVGDSSLPEPRGDGFAVGVIGTNVIVAGGANAGGMVVQTIKAPINGGNYAPAPISSNAVISEWTDMGADIPTPRVKAATAAVDGRIYVMGGATSAIDQIYDAVEEYNPSSNTWRSRSPLPLPVMNAAAAALNGRIYVVGGADGWSVDPVTGIDNDNLAGVLQIYDPTTDTWSFGSSMTSAREGAVAVPYQGRIYVMGGYDNPDPNEPACSTVEVYDPVGNIWQAASFDCPWPAASASAFACNLSSGPLLYFAGGESVTNQFADASYLAMSSMSGWQSIPPLPLDGNSGLTGLSVVTPVQDVYPMVFGGNYYPVGYYNRCFAYRPAGGQSTPSWCPDTSMPYPIGGSPAIAQIGNYVYITGGEGPDYTGYNTHTIRGAITSGIVSSVSSISEAKSAADGTLVQFTQPAVVTRVVTDKQTGQQMCFYVEETDRSSGIRVVGAGDALSPGTRVYVEGVVGVSDSGERQIDLLHLTFDSPATGPLVKPLGMPLRSFGGVSGSSGVNSVGLLVRVWGKITSSASQDGSGHTCFYIDDGSGLLDGTDTSGTPNRGLRVWYPGPSPLPTGVGVGDYVMAEGVCSLGPVLAERITMVTVTDPADLRQIGP